MTQKTRILVIATNKWFSIGQFLAALVRVGFEVAVVCPPANPIRHISNLAARYRLRFWRSRASILEAIDEWTPDFLICNDDAAVRELHSIHRQARAEPDRPEKIKLVELIELSLGNPESFAISRSKSSLISVARALKISCPQTILINSDGGLERHLPRLIYPVLVKLDESWGGRGVRLAHTERELRRAVLELSFPHGCPRSLKWLAARLIGALPSFLRPSPPANMALQRYVCGCPANRAVLCWRGKVLAGISIEAIETASEFGPTTLARIIEHAELAEVAEKLVETQMLTGFVGFDFVLDQSNRAWFIEMNPRVTPACHLRFQSPSLPAILFSKLTGQLPCSDIREVPKEKIALFPNRVSNEARLRPYFDDTPVDEPGFLEACRRPHSIRRMVGAQFRGVAVLGRSETKIVNSIMTEGINDS